MVSVLYHLSLSLPLSLSLSFSLSLLHVYICFIVKEVGPHTARPQRRKTMLANGLRSRRLRCLRVGSHPNRRAYRRASACMDTCKHACTHAFMQANMKACQHARPRLAVPLPRQLHPCPWVISLPKVGPEVPHPAGCRSSHGWAAAMIYI